MLFVSGVKDGTEDFSIRYSTVCCSWCLFVSGVNGDTEDCKVRCSTVSYSQRQLTSDEPETETLQFSLICNSCLFNLNIHKQYQREHNTTSADSTGVEEYAKTSTVCCDIYVEGLDECIISHLCSNSNFDEALKDIVSLIFDKYLAAG